jgi:hypothetical protein
MYGWRVCLVWVDIVVAGTVVEAGAVVVGGMLVGANGDAVVAAAVRAMRLARSVGRIMDFIVVSIGRWCILVVSLD